MNRYVGIRHRVKKTAEGKDQPTQLAIVTDGVASTLVLGDEDVELLWVQNGLKQGDVVAMALGGSGDRLAFALSRQAEKVGATVMRIPPYLLKRERQEESKDNDALLLAQLAQTKPQLFYPVQVRDRDLIWLVECYRARRDSMKERIACEQRLRQRLIGNIFCSQNGGFPEGKIEDLFNNAKANDAILTALVKEENQRDREVEKALEKLEVYQKVFEQVEGCGPSIASRLIAAIQYINRFEAEAQLKKFCGVHVTPEGKFARRRRGEVSSWNPDARQALYLLGDQFNRRPASVWGQKLRSYKAALRQKHPDVVVEDGKKRYTDGHIHKMAIWRTITKFVEWLHAEWWKLEKARLQQ